MLSNGSLLNQIVQWTGACFGITGALMLAKNNKYSKIAFLVFVASNIMWIIFGIATSAKGLIFMNIIFLLINFVGIKNWFFKEPKND